MLRSWRLGAATAVLTLAVGIGTASSMYALVRMALASTSPEVADLPALGRIYASSRALGVERAQLTLKDVDLLASASSFEAVGAYTSDSAEMTAGAEPVRFPSGRCPKDFFPRCGRARLLDGCPRKPKCVRGRPLPSSAT